MQSWNAQPADSPAAIAAILREYPDLEGKHPGSIIAIASSRRELAAMDAEDAAVDSSLATRRARASGTSVVFSLRLDPDELDALQRRAAANNLKPTVLARNLIRIGLTSRGAADVAIALDRAAAAIESVRAAVGV